MEKRRLGKTGHDSSVVAFGGAALRNVTQAEADARVLSHIYTWGTRDSDLLEASGRYVLTRNEDSNLARTLIALGGA